MQRLFHLGCVFAALFLGAVTLQTRGETGYSLSLQESIEMALNFNLDLEIERFEPEMAFYRIGMSYGGYDPQLQLGGNTGETTEPGGLDAENRPFPSTKSQADQFNAGLGGFLSTGLRYDVIGTVDDRDVKRAGGFNLYDLNTRGLVNIEVSQPLLKNMWIDERRMNIRINKKLLKMTELRLLEQIMLVVTQVEEAYFNLIFARENVTVQEEALGLAERLLAENRKRLEVGALAPLDEKQSQSQVAARKADLIEARRALSMQENLMKSLLTNDYASWHARRLLPAGKLEAIAQVFSLQDSWSKAMSQRPDLRGMRTDLERQAIVIKFDRNQLFPSLDLVGSYGRAANAREYEGFFNGIQDNSGPRYSVGAVLRFPLGNRTARANYRVSKTQKMQLLARLKKMEQTIMLQIDDALNLAKANFQQVQATREAREFAQAALDAEQKKLENGLSTSFVVLQLQNDLTLARTNEIRALANYNQALAQLAFDEGDTLRRHGIAIQVVTVSE